MEFVDHDTAEWGTASPFQCWEGGRSALAMVLLDAHRMGLNLADHTDDVAGMLLRSRWFAAATHASAAVDHTRAEAGGRNGLAEAFTPGMRVDSVDRSRRAGLVLRVDLNRDPLLIVQVQWTTRGGARTEWHDPQCLAAAERDVVASDRERRPRQRGGLRLVDRE